MQKPLIALGMSTLVLTACLGPGEPVVLPEGDVEAARVCMVAQGLALRADSAADAPVTYNDFVESMKYPLMAAALSDPFSADVVSEVLTGTDQVVDEISGQDYQGAVATCEARFDIGDTVTLPESEGEAALSCLTLASFMQGAAGADAAAFGEDGGLVGPLFERLDARLDSDPEMILLVVGPNGENAMNSAMQRAFASGAPRQYIEACDARFPAQPVATG